MVTGYPGYRFGSAVRSCESSADFKAFWINYREQSRKVTVGCGALRGPFEHLVLEMTVIFGGASGTLFGWLKQLITLAYICLGVPLAPKEST